MSIENLNGKREPLAERLPLQVPFSISVTTANICNLRCEYCAVSEKRKKRNKPLMDFETFRMAVDSMKDSGWHLKQIVLVGLGEPLLNPDIVRFVSYVKEIDIADKVNIVTNGTLLSREMVISLLEAGIDVIRISVNGLSDEDYLKFTGKKIDYSRFKECIGFLFNNKRRNVKVYSKIMDYMIKTEERKKQFFEEWEPISDVTNIEYLTFMSNTIDYEKSIGRVSREKGLKGFDMVKTSVCPLPFYHIYLNAEGTISACCVAGPWSTPPALVMGDIHEQSIQEIWKGEKFRSFMRRMLLNGKDSADPVCKECKAYLSYIYPEDNIESEAERIAKALE